MNDAVESKNVQLNFELTGDELIAVDRIAKRYMDLCLTHNDQIGFLETMIDLTLTHTQNYPMNFSRLLLTSDSDLIYTVQTIAKAMDRKTGKLKDGFVPNHTVVIVN